jgi:DNA polymerase-3 subunit beta
LGVFANNPDQEQAEDALPVEYQGESLQIGFNVGYLVDVMNALDDDQVKITLANPNSSALIESQTDNRVLYVVMPMRL